MMHKILRKTHIKTIGVLFIGILLVFSSFPVHTEAASVKKKSKVVYNISVFNINSDTVIKKGNSLKIQYKATRTKNGIVKGTKVKFRSSNKKIATVSSKGVIKAKKNGTVKITVYCKSKPGRKKTVKIRVGTPVSAISISGYKSLNKGRKATFQAACNSNATNKSVSWSSSNAKVVKVTSSGVVTAAGYGTATITATALDGSATKGSIKVVVHKYTQNDEYWIAHRGLHTNAIENTAPAFIAAGEARGFRGCECDIWETKHEFITIETQMQSTDQQASVDQTEESTEESVQNSDENLEQAHQEAPIQFVDQQPSVDQTEESTEESVQNSDEITEQAGAEDIPATETTTVDSFDLVINHDSTFKRTLGVDRSVKSMTAKEIRDQIPKACFFDEYLNICKQYNMDPVVEFKDAEMSNEAICRAIDMLYDKGLLDNARLISFYSGVLEKANNYASEKLGHDPYTAYLVGTEDLSVVNHAKEKGYTCISVYKGYLSNNFYNRCLAVGLHVGTWTYLENAGDDDLLYLHTILGKYNLDFATVDYKPF